MAHEQNNDNLEICNAGDYGSEFEYDSELERNRQRRRDLATKDAAKREKLPRKIEVTAHYNKEEGKRDLYHMLSLDAYARHKKFINDYLMYYGGSISDFQRDTSRDKTDFDVIRENHKFLWDDDDDATSWEKRLAKRYYDKLFKEYCIADLSRYKENKIALRWRIEAEVVSGKGQFECGAKKCAEREGLRSWEVNFAYIEHGEKKNALVKLRLCPECSHKLNYHHRKKEIKAKRKAKRTEEDLAVKRQKSEECVESSIVEMPAAEPTVSSEPKSTSADDSNVWTKPLPVTEEKSREDEFDEYFEDMFL